MHYWGKWPDELFCDVGEAASWIGKNLIRWGRIGVTQTKEKYGTARVYCHFYVNSFYSLVRPHYCYIWMPRWARELDHFLWKYTGIGFLITKFLYKWQPFIYVLVYKLALKKWPWIHDEILYGADQTRLFEKAGMMPAIACECPECSYECKRKLVNKENRIVSHRRAPQGECEDKI